MINLMKSRIASERGDSNTVSQLLWIVMAVVLVITVGSVIYKAVVAKGKDVAKCIEDSNMIFGGTGGASSNCGNLNP